MSNVEGTQARILDAAAQLLAAGQVDVSMGQIAQAAGVSRQLLYFHFEGRGDLLLNLSRRVDATVRTAVLQQRIDDAPDAIAALREMVAVQGRIKPRLEGIVAAIDHLRATDADAAAVWNERERSRYRRVREVVARLDAEDCLAHPWEVTAAARMAWSVTSQRAWRELTQAGWSTRRWVEHTTELLVGALVGR